VCIYNNKSTLKKYLLKSLDLQSIKYEKILIDNTTNKFKSASVALNYGIEKASGDYIMFVHQDVSLKSNTWLNDVEKSLIGYTKLGVAGVAGSKQDIDGVYTNLIHGNPPLACGSFRIKNIEEVQTVDECLFIIPSNIAKKNKFDEKTCSGWHLYAVEYCLSVLKLNYQVYLIPNEIYHFSTGFSLDTSYYKILKKVVKKHMNDCTNIRTTVGNWDTKLVQLEIEIFKYKIVGFLNKFSIKN